MHQSSEELSAELDTEKKCIPVNSRLKKKQVEDSEADEIRLLVG